MGKDPMPRRSDLVIEKMMSRLSMEKSEDRLFG
jgi:hypothetical protein